MNEPTRGPAVTVIATIRARAGKESELESVLAALIEPTRSDPGMIAYELHHDLADPATFCFVERWRSDHDLAVHLRQPHVEAFLAREAELVDGTVSVRHLRAYDHPRERT